MAISDTVVFEYYDGSNWIQFASDMFVATGHGDYTQILVTNNWQDKSHYGESVFSGQDGGYINNVKYIASGQFDSGSGTETLNDTNLTATECTLRIAFRSTSSKSLTNVKIFIYDGTTTTVRAPGLEVQAFEQGESNTAWTEINDDSAGVGGSGDALSLANGSGTEVLYYIALSVMAESTGDKPFSIGFSATVT